MLTQVVQSIGWKHPDDRDTIIRKEQLEESIVKLQNMLSDLKNVGGNVGKYVNDRGINTVHDVLVVLRRWCMQEHLYIHTSITQMPKTKKKKKAGQHAVDIGNRRYGRGVTFVWKWVL